MNLSLIVFCIACIVAIKGADPYMPMDITCNIGELYTKSLGGGLCNDVKGQGDAKCQDHCQKQFGAELVGSICSDIRANSKRECICKMKCATGGCQGDPHCISFDGLTDWGYQGLTKHYLAKPCKKGSVLPNFEVRQTNRQWGTSNLAVFDKVDLFIPEWKQTIELATPLAKGGLSILTVNGQQHPIPYRYSQMVQDYKENYVNIYYTDASHNQINLETSFGLRITVFICPWGYTFYANVAVSIPRHADLKGNTCGLLGKWNDDQSDDSIDAKGKKQTMDLFSVNFGDSWCVTNPNTPKSKQDKAKQDHEAHKNQVNKDTNRKGRVENLCKKLADDKVIECGKRMHLFVPSAEDCFTDVSYSDKVDDEKQLVCGILNKYIDACKLNIPQCQ